MHISRLLVGLVVLLAGCGGGTAEPAPSTRASASAADAVPSAVPASEAPSLVPPAGRTWFGMNLDWGTDTVDATTERLGVTPAVWVQFVRLPLGDGDRANLEGFFAQVGAAGAHGLVTVEPHDGLAAVTAGAADDLAAVLHAAWTDHGVATFVRFGHEMNGSWYPWGQQPGAYAEAFRVVADAVHAGSPASAMVWAPNDGAGYPFTGGAFAADAGTPEAEALDTDGDGELGRTDDPYGPYWPGDDVVDWVGMSVYFWGQAYPWGENELPADGRFAAQITGSPTGAHDDEVAVPDFYGTYAEGHNKPMAVIETAALYDPAGEGPDEASIKRAWFEQVFSESTRAAFPKIGMINWFEWAKPEAEVDALIDWRLGSDPALARSLLAGVPQAWLLFAEDR